MAQFCLRRPAHLLYLSIYLLYFPFLAPLSFSLSLHPHFHSVCSTRHPTNLRQTKKERHLKSRATFRLFLVHCISNYNIPIPKEASTNIIFCLWKEIGRVIQRNRLSLGIPQAPNKVSVNEPGKLKAAIHNNELHNLSRTQTKICICITITEGSLK